jgi:mono/diheme cytochrome c family protein
MGLRRLLIGGLVAVVVWGGAAIWWKESRRWSVGTDDPVMLARGQSLYMEHCASCHGKKLEGQPNWQERKPNGELPAPPHDATGHTWHHSDEQLAAITKHGTARFAPPDVKTAMPAFVGKLSDDDIRAVIAFIKSNWPAQIRDRQARLNKP